MRKMLAVAIKELRQIRRDRRSLLILLFVPAFFLLVYGYALNFDIRNIRLAVQDDDRSSASREVISAFVNSGYFDLVATIVDGDDVTGILNRGDARAVLVIPARFGADAAAGRPTSLQILINGDNANTATTVQGYAVGPRERTSRRATRCRRASGRRAGRCSRSSRASGTTRSCGARCFSSRASSPTSRCSRPWSPRRSRSCARRKPARWSRSAWRPSAPRPTCVGKTAPYFVVSLLSAMGIVGVSMLLFDLPVRGSWLALVGCVSLFLIGALAFGVLISTIAPSQQVAFQIALLTSFLPTFMLSGFIFPISSMPAFLQAITHVVPARYLLVILRGLLLKGVELRLLWVDVASLALFSVVVLALASIRLKREWA